MSTNPIQTPNDDPVLREALKRCSPATYYAACKFRATGQVEDLRTVLLGVIERFVERDLRAKLQASPDVIQSLRLSQDLGLDSLTMMEIVMVAEEVLAITISNEELTRLSTLGQVQRFIESKLTDPQRVAATKANATGDDWNLAAVGEQMRAIEVQTPAPIDRLANHRVNHA